jgi:predicted RND superfamily exporter protein
MEERLVIVDKEGYSIEVDDNFADVDRTKEKLAQNPNVDAVFIGITSPYGEQQCVGITLEDAERLANEIQRLIKVIKE